MGHHHHHHHAPEQHNLAFAVATLANLIFTIIEAIYALYAGSSSLLADAGHNLGDVFSLLLAWGANWLLTRPSGKRYSYGYKRTTILAALINAIALAATTTLIAFDSVYKLFNPTPIHEWTVIIVASIGIIINGGTSLLFLSGHKHDLNIKGAFLHLAVDALVSLGVVIAALIMMKTGWYIIDPIIGIMIIGIIFMTTWHLLQDSVILMLDAVPRHIDHERVEAYFYEIDGVIGLHDLHIWGLSTKETALTVHLCVPDRHFSNDEYIQIAHDLKEQFKIDHPTIQVESTNYCPSNADCE